jgi:hypothetical protein
MISPELRRIRVVKTLTGSGKPFQKESEPHRSAWRDSNQFGLLKRYNAQARIVLPVRLRWDFLGEGNTFLMFFLCARLASIPRKNAFHWILLLLPLAFLQTLGALAQTVRVDTTPSRAIKFDPDQALGSSMDILPANLIDTVYSEPILKESLSAGWGPITYRQNTELTIAAWHWNPNGKWSDTAHQRGYFTGSSEPNAALRHSFGYSLPHRGNTRSDAAQGKYSRLTDGDPTTYWKSNPYLTKQFTGEEGSRNPQWIVIDFGTTQDIDAIRIAWANPYARKYAVQYWTGEDAFGKPTAGAWTLFPAVKRRMERAEWLH